jgi:hypothetical protein
LQLVLSVPEKLPLGAVESTVQFKAKLSKGGEWASSLPVSGRIVPDVEASPPAFPGGGRTIGESFEFDVSLSSLARKPFSVRSAKAVGNGLSVTAKEGRYVVRQDCVAVGEQAGMIEFEIEGADGRYATKVAVNYTGLRP